MAGGQERVLRRRIKSVQSTKKITKAMELIAASRIVKAQQRVAASRPYADQLTEVLRNLAAAGAGSDHPLLNERPEIRNVGFVVIAGDRGMCGAYNASVIRAAEAAMRAARDRGQGVRLVTVGKKVESYFKFRHYDIAVAVNGTSERPTYEDARRVAAAMVPVFEAGEVDRVVLVYTQFLSLASQKVVIRQFMPLETAEALQGGGHGGHGGHGEGELQASYEFEPDPDALLGALLPRYAEARLFAAMLDASAAELANRQRAMAAASDNADELITKLTRLRNRARQDSITTEIMEIVSGAEALSERH